MDIGLSRDRATELARAAWDEAAPIHEKLTLENLLRKFAEPTFSCLDDVHASELRRIGVQGKDVAQFNCNNGRELLSVKRLGARRCVGFDISAHFIAQARTIAEAAGIDAEFVATDVYKIPDRHDGAFDIVFATAGALCFMPDLDGYLATTRRLLRPQGHIVLYDCHPISDMFKLDRERGEGPLELEFSYFDGKPVLRNGGLDYHSNTTYGAKPIYYFHHKLSTILMACINAGFHIEFFEEYARDPSQACRKLESMPNQPPLSFMLTCKRHS
jgi:SAM-dependent methyltransferase